jgi:hypothetical protein
MSAPRDRWDLLLFSPGLGAIVAAEAQRGLHVGKPLGLALALILTFIPIAWYVARMMRRRQS